MECTRSFKWNGYITYSGLLVENNPIMVRSKCVSHPDFLQHGLWEVPDSYGTLDPEYYTRLELRDIEEFYLQKADCKN